ncbi:MAG: hypothetical protein ABI959_03640 [Candidatus Dormiibacterota bacterium]
MLLRVGPSIPGSFHGGVDELKPFVLSRVVWRRGQGQHLPPSFVADQRHNRLTSGAAHVTIGARIVRVGGHEPLLHREHKVVDSPQGGGWQRGIMPPEPHLKGADCLAKRLWRLSAVIKI